MYKLNDNRAQSSVSTEAFDMFSQAGYAPVFKDTIFAIRSYDVYWKTPPNIFESQPGVASDQHEMKLLAIKWIANPF